MDVNLGDGARELLSIARWISRCNAGMEHRWGRMIHARVHRRVASRLWSLSGRYPGWEKRSSAGRHHTGRSIKYGGLSLKHC